MRVGRIELPPQPWEGRVLPLNHTRNKFYNTTPPYLPQGEAHPHLIYCIYLVIYRWEGKMSKEERNVVDYALIVALIILVLALFRVRIDRVLKVVPANEEPPRAVVLHKA